MQKSFQVARTQAYPLGASFQQEGLRIAAVCDQRKNDGSRCEAGVILYDKRHTRGLKIPFPEEYRVGAVCSMLILDYHCTDCHYLLYQGEEIYQDPYCKGVENLYRYGAVKKTMPRCEAGDRPFDWQEDTPLGISYEDAILYALHVRGFTKHQSSGVKHKGTYSGIVEKIPYLQDLGINMVLLMPSYEFDEVMPEHTVQTMEEAVLSYKQKLPEQMEEKADKKPRLNYWGYQKGLYYIPKSAYASEQYPVIEYKRMIRSLHKSGIGVLMQFYFPPEVSSIEILDILRYWVLEYHIDGFHLMGAKLPMELLSREPLLTDTLLLSDRQYQKGQEEQQNSLGWMNDGFLYDMRRFLKGDDNQMESFLYHVREKQADTGTVNYMAKWDGFRLADLVSFDRKHNEENGEDNKDGTDYNCSWNCGIEGKSRKKAIVQLRARQMKNAMTLLFMSQGTPLLYSGDEFGNTQGGNNNPYCQDNAIAWIKWDYTLSGSELLEYTKRMIALRKAHPILHSKLPLRGTDYLSCGYPDISVHGKEAWQPDLTPASRTIGMMYCGYYGEKDGRRDDSLFYIAINMHWELHYLGLPKLPKGKQWSCLVATAAEAPEIEVKETTQEICIPPRTIAIYHAADVLETKGLTSADKRAVKSRKGQVKAKAGKDDAAGKEHV